MLGQTELNKRYAVIIEELSRSDGEPMLIALADRNLGVVPALQAGGF